MPDIDQNQQIPETQAPEVVKPIVKPVFKKDNKKNLFLIGGITLLVLAGIVTGWLLSGAKKGSLISPSGDSVAAPGAKSGSEEAGIADESTFRDSAEGMLEEGGVNGEGTHHLEREGGASQNVYLTSTVIDLQSFVGKKVKVWGETISGKQAGWLMDVGKIKVTQ